MGSRFAVHSCLHCPPLLRVELCQGMLQTRTGTASPYLGYWDRLLPFMRPTDVIAVNNHCDLCCRSSKLYRERAWVVIDLELTSTAKQRDSNCRTKSTYSNNHLHSAASTVPFASHSAWLPSPAERPQLRQRIPCQRGRSGWCHSIPA